MEEDEGRKKYKKYRAMIEYQNTFKYKSFGEYFGGKKDKLVHQFEQLYVIIFTCMRFIL